MPVLVRVLRVKDRNTTGEVLKEVGRNHRVAHGLCTARRFNSTITVTKNEAAAVDDLPDVSGNREEGGGRQVTSH